MGQLHVEAERTAQAAPAIVWALVSDVTTYPRWGPWREAAYRRPGDASPGGPGAVYWQIVADLAGAAEKQAAVVSG